MPASSATSGPLDRVLAGRTPRERMLLLLVAALALGGGLYFSLSSALSARRDHAEAAEVLASAEQAAQRASRGGLAGRLEEAREEVRAWSWQAPSAEVGQVLAQRDMMRIASSAGLRDVRIEARIAMDQAGEVTLAPLDLRSKFEWRSLSGFMTALEGTGKGFVLDSVEMTDDREPELRILVRIPVMIAAGGEA